jgi:hypothetical protein
MSSIDCICSAFMSLRLVEHLNVKDQDVKFRHVAGPSNMICGFKTRFDSIFLSGKRGKKLTKFY